MSDTDTPLARLEEIKQRNQRAEKFLVLSTAERDRRDLLAMLEKQENSTADRKLLLAMSSGVRMLLIRAYQDLNGRVALPLSQRSADDQVVLAQLSLAIDGVEVCLVEIDGADEKFSKEIRESVIKLNDKRMKEILSNQPSSDLSPSEMN